MWIETIAYVDGKDFFFQNYIPKDQYLDSNYKYINVYCL
jgi:hypothetical protein